jgi:hypothetical protein
MLEEVTIDCPWCGEAITLQVDLSAGSQSYVEDCQVCCQPIIVQAMVDDDGALAGLHIEREA